MIEQPAIRYCPFCQANIPNEATVCYHCGRDLLYNAAPTDTSPTQPLKLTNPYGQRPPQQVGQSPQNQSRQQPPPPYEQPYSQPPDGGQPPDNSQLPYWQAAYPPPAPAENRLPTWLVLIAAASLLLIFACGIAMFAIMITSRNGMAGLGAEVSTEINQIFGGAGSENPAPTAAPQAFTPTPPATSTPAPTDTPQPTLTPQAAASLTPDPTQVSILARLLSPECKGALDQLSRVSDQVKNDPLKVLDEAWRKAVDQATADMKTSCGSLDSASPIPGEIGQVQQAMKQATSEFDQAKLLWNEAIDQHDPSKAISAAQHVGEATKNLSLAIRLLQKLVP